MTRTRSLPLGIDIGETRIRVARMVRAESGTKHLVAVATRDVDADCDRQELLPLVLDELAREVGVGNRACVVSLPASSATLTLVTFPKMSWSERRRAASFESARLVPWNVKDVATLVRVRSVNRSENRFAIGVARRDALEARETLVRRARLRAVRVDHEGYALRRAFPQADAVVDVASTRTTIHAFGPRGVASADVALGGASVTRSIGMELKIAGLLAEKRKRVLGTAGAGEAARAELVRQVASAVENLRSFAPIRRIALVGNGARLPALDAHLESATGCIVELPVSGLLQLGEYPDDVIRAAAPDWTLAVALADWSRS